MKYTALTPIKHDGKRLEEGATLTLDEGREADRLLELGAIAPVQRKRAPDAGASGTAEPAAPDTAGE